MGKHSGVFILFPVLALVIFSGCARSQASTTSLGVAEPPRGAAILQRACTVCHNLDGLNAYADSWGQTEWRSMIGTMISYGAVVTPAEVDVLSEYLAVNYGTGVLGATDNADMAALIDSACTTCHGLDLLTTNTAGFTGANFRETVVRMIQYGAPVPEDQVEPMVEYLVETYGG
jgi:mono/diheme cytochrome c family protein